MNLENILKIRGGRVQKGGRTARKIPMTMSRSANLKNILKIRQTNSGVS